MKKRRHEVFTLERISADGLWADGTMGTPPRRCRFSHIGLRMRIRALSRTDRNSDNEEAALEEMMDRALTVGNGRQNEQGY